MFENVKSLLLTDPSYWTILDQADVMYHQCFQEYGEVPTYLQRRKVEMDRAQEEYDQYVAEHFRRGAMRSLTAEERDAIIDGLKANWEDIHDQYQGLSVVTDTAPKKNRKERMEAQMKQLERDIEIFEKHRVIYIADWIMYCRIFHFE